MSFEIDTGKNVALITPGDDSISCMAESLNALASVYGRRKILYTITTDDTPERVIVIFE